MPALQEDRWNEVLKEKVEIWKEFGLKKEFVEDMWNRIHKESLEIEK
jgi:chorismate mutase